MKDTILSLNKKDFVITFYKGSGAGGQKRNKTSNAARVKHPESGAIGECQETRSKDENLKRAFHRMIESREFQLWLKMTTSAILAGYKSIEERVEDQMKDDNLKIEYFNPKE